jgi:hypothetical protein
LSSIADCAVGGQEARGDHKDAGNGGPTDIALRGQAKGYMRNRARERGRESKENRPVPAFTALERRQDACRPVSL